MRISCLAWVFVVACGSGGGNNITPPDAGTNLGVGAPCSMDGQCRMGLVCAMGKCAVGHATADGSPCTLNDDCKVGSYCGADRKCAPGGMKGNGEQCLSDGDCQSGLRCNIVGFNTICQPEGMVDVGGMCTKNGDCFGGLTCLENKCTPIPPSMGKVPLAIPSWKGATCTDDMGPTKAYFHVPRGMNDGDFYRLPFPNDIRKKNGKIDLSGHPSPGSAVLGFDAVDRYLRDIEQNADGFSPSPVVTLRFSASPDFDSLKANGVVRFVDLTDGVDVGYSWVASTARNKYVCDNWMALRPPGPIAPGHTFAMYITTGAKDANKGPISRDADFAPMLASMAPSDQALTAAYAAYKPFRDFLTAKMVNPDTILTAAVFTTGHPEKLPSKMPAAIAASTAPTATQWVKCGSGPSPCPQAMGDRACGAADPDFDELHALLTIPIFQKGTAPYVNVPDGGEIDVQMDGTPKEVRTEQVCMSLTVPKTTMPQAGWPLVIFAHGTGGNFRSHITTGVAKRLANADMGAVKIAVLGIDQVAHGTRRGTSMDSPDTLFYNFANPSAARGNPLQGALDQLSLARFAKSFDLVANMSPTMNEIKFSQVHFWGHSQGATEGSLSIPYTKDVSSVVLSGQGASLMDALITKTSPVNIAGIMPIVAEDLAVGAYHPVPALLQNAIDPADPLHDAIAILYKPPMGVSQKHVFQPFAQKDTYSPVFTQLAWFFAAGLGVAKPPTSVTMQDMTLQGQMQLNVPVSSNVNGVTGVLREYAPANYDGHFVAFQNAEAMADVDHFLATAALGQVPKVGK